MVGWGTQLRILREVNSKPFFSLFFKYLKAAQIASEKDGVSCEIIDLQTLYPYDIDTLANSVKKTGRIIISHEAPVKKSYSTYI